MAWTFSIGPRTDRDLSRPVAWGTIWKKGSWGEMALYLLQDKWIGEDLERSR